MRIKPTETQPNDANVPHLGSETVPEESVTTPVERTTTPTQHTIPPTREIIQNNCFSTVGV